MDTIFNIETPVEATGVEHSAAIQDGVCSTNSNPLADRYLEARNRLRRLNSIHVAIEAGSRGSAALALKSAVYFTLDAIKDRSAAQKLEGWNEIDVQDREQRKYLHPMKYLFRECSAPGLKSKMSVWSAIAREVHTHNLPEASFLDVLKRNGGIDRWYRSLPKDPSKGRPKGDKPKPGSVEDIRHRRTTQEAEAAAASGKSVHREFLEGVLEPLKAQKREVVVVAFDVTQSALGFATLIKRLRVFEEFAGARPLCGISDEDWRKEMGEAADQAADPEVTETETHEMKEAA